MSKVRVEDLSKEQLDEWVATAQGWEYMATGRIGYTPTTNPAQWAELIENFDIGLWKGHNLERTEYYWCANYDERVLSCDVQASSPAIAICRAVIASVYGEYVEVPDVRQC